MHTVLLTTWSLQVCKVNVQVKVIIKRENVSTSCTHITSQEYLQWMFVPSLSQLASMSMYRVIQFSLFFTPEIVRNIVDETNRYAALCLEGKSATWTTNESEIQAYFGFYILMGMVKEPEIRVYWSKDGVFHYSPIADRISRNRFEDISRYLRTLRG